MLFLVCPQQCYAPPTLTAWTAHITIYITHGSSTHVVLHPYAAQASSSYKLSIPSSTILLWNPPTLVRQLTSAPLSTKAAITLTYPQLLALCRAVSPISFCKITRVWEERSSTYRKWYHMAGNFCGANFRVKSKKAHKINFRGL